MDKEANELLTLVSMADKFARGMKQKLIDKYEEGYRGWDDPKYKEGMEESLKEHVGRLINGDRYQAVDIANLAMFLAFLLAAEQDGE